MLKTPERDLRSRIVESRRNLFDVDDHVTSLSPTSSEISSPPKNVASLKTLATNFDQMFLDKTPPKSAPGSLRPRRSPRLLKGVTPLSDSDDVIPSGRFYGKTSIIKEGDGAGMLAAALSTVPKIRTRLFFDDVSSAKKRSSTASHPRRPLKRAKTEPSLNKPDKFRRNKFTINFPKKKSPHIKKEKTSKPTPPAQTKRKARDEPNDDLPLKRSIMGNKTRYNWEMFSTENTKKFFKNLNSSITMTPPSSTKKKSLLNQKGHFATPVNSPESRTLQVLKNNVQSPKVQNLELEKTEIVKEIQEILDEDETLGNPEVTSLLEALNDDEGKENVDEINASYATPERSKYFSIFNNTPESSHSSSQSPRELKNRRRTLGIGCDQLLLDAGQNKLREVECEACGLVYLNGVPEDEINHDKHHAEVTQMLFNGFKNERIVKVIGEDRISLIKDTDPIAWKRRVQIYISIIDSELGFPSDQEFPRQVYIYVKNKRVVGLLLAKRLDRAFRLLTFNDDTEAASPLTDYTMICSEESYPTRCGISRIWVAKGERRRGVAVAMLDSLRRNFISHCILSINDLAFSAPTSDGINFARKYCKRTDFLVYTARFINANDGTSAPLVGKLEEEMPENVANGVQSAEFGNIHMKNRSGVSLPRDFNLPKRSQNANSVVHPFLNDISSSSSIPIERLMAEVNFIARAIEKLTNRYIQPQADEKILNKTSYSKPYWINGISFHVPDDTHSNRRSLKCGQFVCPKCRSQYSVDVLLHSYHENATASNGSREPTASSGTSTTHGLDYQPKYTSCSPTLINCDSFNVENATAIANEYEFNSKNDVMNLKRYDVEEANLRKKIVKQALKEKRRNKSRLRTIHRDDSFIRR